MEKPVINSSAFLFHPKSNLILFVPMTESIDALGKLATALLLEKKYEEEQHLLQSKTLPIKELRDRGLCWWPIRLKNRQFGFGGRPLIDIERNPADEQEHQFQPGTPVYLLGEEDAKARGTVVKIDERSMSISLYEDDIPEWIDDCQSVHIAFDSRSYKEMEFALNQVINAQRNRLATLREVLLGDVKPEFTELSTSIDQPGLNDSQKEAIANILRAKDVAVIHGPPGTGKTTTLAAAVKEILRSEEQVLCCAPSNAAADNLLLKLLHSGVKKVVRIGELSRIDDELTEHALDQMVESSNTADEVRKLKRQALEIRKKAEKYKRQFGPKEREERRKLYAEARSLQKDAVQLEKYAAEKILDDAEVIVSTLIGSSNYILRGRQYNTVCIDEAGQATAPASWVAAIRGERLILAGDPFQLPPTVKNPEAEKAGLSISLLEQIMKNKQVDKMLDTQYRMNENIMYFSAHEFYNSELKAAESVKDHLLSNGEPSLEFIDTAGCGFEEKSAGEGFSIWNEGELGIAQKRLNELVQTTENKESIGIISPYREQVNRLRSTLGNNKRVRCSTVDGFQGQEKDAIILSLVRSNQEGKIGFLMDFRRMNVALTRARKKLIVIGDSSTIGNVPFYSRFLETVEERGLYRSAWEWMDM